MIWIIIPAFNESLQILSVISNVNTIFDMIHQERNIVIVDDGSTDGTADVVQSLGSNNSMTIIRHPVNQGVSAAFRSGFDFVLDRSSSHDLILTMEANKNTDPSIIPTMLTLIEESADLVLASCYAPDGKVIGDPFLRYFMSRSVNWLLSIVFPIREIHTYTSFYRLGKQSLFAQIRAKSKGKYFQQDGFVCMADLLIQISRIPNVRIKEVPLILRSDIREFSSKMKIGRTIIGYFHLFYSNLTGKTISHQ